MTKYSFEGKYRFYKEPEPAANISGVIDVIDNYFEGEITDTLTTNPTQYIKGHFINQNQNTHLIFSKTTTNTNLAKVIHNLTKSLTQNIQGEYNGTWQMFPYNITFNKNAQIYLAQIDWKPGLGEDSKIFIYKKDV